MSAPVGIGLPAIGNDPTIKGRSGGQKERDAGDVFSQAIDRLSAKDPKGQRGGTGNGQARAEASANGKGDIEVDITNAPRGGKDVAGPREIGREDRSSLLALFENTAKAGNRPVDGSKPDDTISQEANGAQPQTLESASGDLSESSDAAEDSFDLTQDVMDFAGTQTSQGVGTSVTSSLQQALAKPDTISAWLQSRSTTTALPVVPADGQLAVDGPDIAALKGAEVPQSADGEIDVFRMVGGKGDVPSIVVDAVARSIAQGMAKGEARPDGTKADPIRLDGASRGAKVDGVDPDRLKTAPMLDSGRGVSDTSQKTSATTPADRLADLGGRQDRADNMLRAGADLSILESRKFLGVAAGQTSTAGIISTVTENGEWNAMLRDVASTSATTLDTARNASNTLKIQLNPVELGTVTATFRMSGGHLTIELKVETIEAYRQLSDDQSGLAKALKAQGIDAQNVVVQHVGSDRSAQSASAGPTSGNGAAGQQGQMEGGSSQQSATGQQRGEGGSDGRRGSGREQGDVDARRTDRAASGDVYL
ncbi:flagellar hook-length control protein FliK [Georhizobium profundi]|uniref:Flagellar hook-length control protein FliK n=1 Tax=Georhizobium profundi TaxID=2341112 RepID=A0A3S9B1U5_9HYPH|nr:flagellar hook-length control protein FliK [Georhizobium profundi]AZN70872.1 flagellar hook-length control protein FliK [Georhizobium profundi]